MSSRRCLWLSVIGAVLVTGCVEGHHTLRWDQKLDASTRFIVLTDWNSEAVLDRETGLLWQKSPETYATSWSSARGDCLSKTVGGRKGWRLPAIAELTSLIDPSVKVGPPVLPPGHPFLNIGGSIFWSASTSADNPAFAWAVGFDVDTMGPLDKSISTVRIWCVRGGMQANEY